MLERHIAWSKCSSLGRRYRLIEGGSGAEHLDLNLQRTSAASSKNPRVKIHCVKNADYGGETLRYTVALEIAAGIECGGMGRTGRSST